MANQVSAVLPWHSFEREEELNASEDPIVARFRAALQDIYGDRIERVVLFGSRARAEAQPDSDYDVAVFFRSMPDRWEEARRLADLRVDFIDETGVFFDAKPFPSAAYVSRTPLMHNIRRDGRDV